VLAIEPALRLLVPLPLTVGAPCLTFMSISTRPLRRGFFLRLACVSAVLNHGFHVVSLP
jgi:predicted permease